MRSGADVNADSVGLTQGKIERQWPVTSLYSFACTAVPALAFAAACWIKLLLLHCCGGEVMNILNTADKLFLEFACMRMETSNYSCIYNEFWNFQY